MGVVLVVVVLVLCARCWCSPRGDAHLHGVVACAVVMVLVDVHRTLSGRFRCKITLVLVVVGRLLDLLLVRLLPHVAFVFLGARVWCTCARVSTCTWECTCGRG